jgi:hypothetical protein
VTSGFGFLSRPRDAIARRVSPASIAVLTVGLILSVSGLVGCAAAADADRAPSATKSATPVSDARARETPPSTVPAPTTTLPLSPKQVNYEAAIADWSDPLPPGYSWPAWADLPHIDPYGVGQLGEADNASGVYRCILIDAAWHAYFEANDAVASEDYATRADSYAIPDNPSTLPVTQNGVIIGSDLAAANGICLGIVGDLDHSTGLGG